MFEEKRKISKVAQNILEKRYFMPGEHKWEDIANRVVENVIADAPESRKEITRQMIKNGYFIPNSPCLVNAGKPGGGLSACFVVDFPDTIEGIYKTKLDFALIARKGGGCGTSLSKIRPEGSKVAGSTHGYAGGPIKFADTISHDADALTQAGFRSMAIMFTISVYHPDVVKFITAKAEEGRIANANISVTVDNDFMNAVISDKKYWTRFKGKKYQEYNARDIFDMIIEGMWKNGEPGILFYDRINDSPYKYAGEELIATNPSLRKGTKVITDLGVFPIEELEGKTFKVINLNGELSDAKCFLSGNDKPLYKINLSGGIYYYATGEHKWAVSTGKNNKIVVKKSTLELSEGDKLPCNVSEKPTFGEIGSYSDGFFAGWLCGDGWITKRGDNGKTQVGVIVSEKDAESGIKSILEEKFSEIGVKTSFPLRQHANGRKWYEVNTINKSLDEFIDKFGITNKTQGLPKSIWNDCSKEFVYGFVDGLISSDGSVSKSGKITITTAHENFAKDVIDLLGVIGIPANMANGTSHISGREKEYSRYDICFPAHLLVGKLILSNVYKQNAIAETSTSRVKKNYFRKVLSVEKTNLLEDVWDISVYDNDHCFALPGVITGNCSEQPLSENGSCNLGSIDLSKFLDSSGNFEWDKFEIAVRYGMRFLDAVIDAGEYPTPEIAEWSKTHRAVGLGIMGYADLLLMKEIAYGSEEAVQLLGDILSFMDTISVDESVRMGEEYGIPEKCKLLPEPRRNITTNTVAPTGCQKAETLIETDSGLFRLSEIIDVNGETWQDINLSVHQDKNTAISNKGFINGLASTKKIKLSSGIDLESTPNHQYKIIRNGIYEWCAAEDINIGDIFPSKIGGYNNSLEADLVQPSYINSKTGVMAKDLRFPNKMTPELGFLLGCFYADGSVHKRGIRISQNPLDKEKIEKIVMIIKDVFDYDAIVEEGHTCTEIYINSVKLLSYLKDNEILKEKSLKVSVPKKIRESSKNSIREFINGYFMCDGCERGYGYIDTGSYQMAQDLAVLLRATGTNVRISERTKIRGHKSSNPMYRVFFVGYGSIDFPKEKEKYVKEETRERYELAKRLVGEHFIADTVINIEDGKCATYDISVPEGNMYVANGVISHNTISLISGCSSGIEPIFSEITVRNDKTGTYTFENDLASKDYFRCAVSANGAKEVTWQEHIDTLAEAQKYIQSGVSKTINFPNNTKRETIANAIMLAWEKGCKGVAVYRNGSRKVEVLSPKNVKKDKCPICGNDMVEIRGEKHCIFCKKENIIEETTTYYD